MNKRTFTEKVLVVGGLGYIGQHVIFELLENGYDVICIDNLSNSSQDYKNFFEQKYNNERKRFKFYSSLYEEIYDLNFVSHVIHLAASKYVQESLLKPLQYHKNNNGATIRVLELMLKYDIKNLIYASSSVVYQPTSAPITEEQDYQFHPNSPYASSKINCERILKDFIKTYPNYSISCLRFGNPAGYHENGFLGTKSNGGVIDKMVQCYISGEPFKFNVREERNKTQIRSFIHVCDLAKLHINFLKSENFEYGIQMYNVSSFHYSIQELFEEASTLFDKKIDKTFSGWKEGDLLISKLDCTKLQSKFQWGYEYDIRHILKTTFDWYNKKSTNKNSY